MRCLVIISALHVVSAALQITAYQGTACDKVAPSPVDVPAGILPVSLSSVDNPFFAKDDVCFSVGTYMGHPAFMKGKCDGTSYTFQGYSNSDCTSTEGVPPQFSGTVPVPGTCQGVNMWSSVKVECVDEPLGLGFIIAIVLVVVALLGILVWAHKKGYFKARPSQPGAYQAHQEAVASVWKVGVASSVLRVEREVVGECVANSVVPRDVSSQAGR